MPIIKKEEKKDNVDTEMGKQIIGKCYFDTRFSLTSI